MPQPHVGTAELSIISHCCLHTKEFQTSRRIYTPNTTVPCWAVNWQKCI